jgi:hypothetical protein
LIHATERLLNDHIAGREPLKILAASGQLGFGIPQASFERGMARQPHVVGCDMGSIDPGPYYLGSGEMAAPRTMVKRDLALVLTASLNAGVPLIIGSAGTAGATPHLEATLAVLREIATEKGLSFRLVTVRSDLKADIVLNSLAKGELQPIGPMPEPSEEDVILCQHIVGQCGTETLARALALDPDVLITGRACDTAIFSVFPELLGYPQGLSLHMAKVIECTSLCCQPGGRDAMLATLDMDGFTLESMNPECHATPASVAAHALYEQANPYEVEEPGGTLRLNRARYEAVDGHRTRVSGAEFEPRAQPTLKIEGSAYVGSRVVLIAGVADPRLLSCLPEVLAAITEKVRTLLQGDWCVVPHIYGQGAVRPLPSEQFSRHEAGLVVEFIAKDADEAMTVASVFKQNLLHHAFPQRLTTAGNLAFCFTPPELAGREAYRFVLYHVMHNAPLDEIFQIEVQSVAPEWIQ